MNPLIPAIISTIVDTVSPGISDGQLLSAPVAPTYSTGVNRLIPDDAPKAAMTPPQAGVVYMDRTAVPFATGAQIRDQNNRIVLPATLSERQLVRFKVDPAGQVTQVWILTSEEREQPAPTFQ